MVVIADTSPLNYLILIGQVDLLPQLYGQIAIPPLSEELDAGELEAILLAIEQQPDALLLIDDNAGRRESAQNSAAAMGVVKLRTALDALLATNFHVSRRIVRRLLDVDAP
jgi:predicted nucleic acid-binding protein